MDKTGTLTERYRPKTLDAMIGQEQAVRLLRGLIAQGVGQFPHLLFAGPPGTGKTTAARIVAHELLGDGYESNWLDMNGSDERGIITVRERIVPWLDKAATDGAPYKVLFVDEADMLTPEAQGALRRPIEDGSEHTRFILAANSPQKLIPPIHSRLLTVRFRPMTEEALRAMLVPIAMDLYDDAEDREAHIRTAIGHCDGDARAAINLLSGTADGDAILLLDRRIVSLFDTSVPQKDRIDGFLAFLRAEGITEYEHILAEIGTAAMSNVKDMGKLRTFLIKTGEWGFRLTQVQEPLSTVRSYLWEVVP